METCLKTILNTRACLRTNKCLLTQTCLQTIKCLPTRICLHNRTCHRTSNSTAMFLRVKILAMLVLVVLTALGPAQMGMAIKLALKTQLFQSKVSHFRMPRTDRRQALTSKNLETNRRTKTQPIAMKLRATRLPIVVLAHPLALRQLKSLANWYASRRRERLLLGKRELWFGKSRRDHNRSSQRPIVVVGEDVLHVTPRFLLLGLSILYATRGLPR
ncbi:hypothetical protein BDZ45DRAFT_400773 [Acephala macrosclerotiorum]|nr:hypothetical protein BDZ45DRAFT_400773 [Acephala macrosclerotiorum]